jgi:hypothetical protein
MGTRTIRLALGLFLRGISADGRNIVGRWPDQMAELKQLSDLSRVDGWAPEYWSPPPRWKSTGSYYNGTLAGFNESFLEDFCSAVVQDIAYLNSSGLPVTWWGLQNEPFYSNNNFTAEQACGNSVRSGWLAFSFSSQPATAFAQED